MRRFPFSGLLAGLLIAASAEAAEPPTLNLYATLATTPAAAFVRPGGGKLQLEALKGRPALVNFWATWCPPCRRELPMLAKVHGRYGKKIAFLGLAVEDNAEFVGEYAGAYGLRYPVAAGREPAIALMQALGNEQAGMPFTVVLDDAGRVVYSKRGLVTEKDLAQALKPLLRP